MHRYSSFSRHTRRSCHDRLFHIRSPQCIIARFPHLFRHGYPNGGHRLDMVPRRRLYGPDRRLAQCHRLAAYGGIIVSQLDNLIRFILQKKMADTHPLITIFGVVIGLSLFGFMGVIFGPLLLSLFFLFVDMFKREYLDTRK